MGGLLCSIIKEELEKLGAEITTREIHQEPELWEELLASFTAQKSNQILINNDHVE